MIITLASTCTLSGTSYYKPLYSTTQPTAEAILGSGTTKGVYLRYYYKDVASCLARSDNWYEMIAMAIGTSVGPNGENCDQRRYPDFNGKWSCPISGIGMFIEPHSISGDHSSDCGGTVTAQTSGSQAVYNQLLWTEGDCSLSTTHVNGMYVLNVLPGCALSTRGIDSDGAALCDFWTTLPSVGRTALTNWCQGSAPYNPCSPTSQWLGVTCSSAPRVTSIYLEVSFGGGVLPGSLGTLDELTSLHIFDMSSSLSGSLPAALGALTSLTSLDIQGTLIKDKIPPQLGFLTGLVNLNLKGNKLTGSLPSTFGRLNSLTRLSIHHNSISGSLPTQIGLMTELLELLLHSNSLVGSLPTELGLLTKLRILDLDTNSLSGGIPTQMGLMAGLSDLKLDGNSLSGAAPSGLCSRLGTSFIRDSTVGCDSGGQPTMFATSSSYQVIEFVRRRGANVTQVGL
jgi:hypothetical protein